MEANFMQRGKIRCPACGKECDNLDKWTTVDNISFYACADCLKLLNTKGLSLYTGREQTLLIGYFAGHNAAMQAMRDFLSAEAKKQ